MSAWAENNLQSSIRLAQAGLPVFPCRPDKEVAHDGSILPPKSPRIQRWSNNSTTDEQAVRRWWDMFPESVAAIDLAKANLLAIDLDRHAPDKDGVANFISIAAENGDSLHNIPAVSTPNNGYHLYYRQPPHHTFGNREGALRGKGINIRGAGGYTIGPGAFRPDGKGWLDCPDTPNLAHAFLTGNIPVLPDWLQLLIRGETRTDKAGEADGTLGTRERQYASGTLRRLQERLASMGEGSGRNNALYEAAYVLSRMSASGWLTEDAIKSSLWAACQENGYISKDGVRQTHATIASGISAGKLAPHEPLTERGGSNYENGELFSSITSGAAGAESSVLEEPRPLRRELPSASPFPLSALGELLGGAAEAIMCKVQCPDAIAAMSVLGAASLAAQGHCDISIPATGHAKPLSLFLVTVAASGERKSAADFEALSPIREYEQTLRKSFESLMPAHLNRLEIWESERESIKRNKSMGCASKAVALDALGVKPARPLTPILTCPEPTFEGLCRLYMEGLPAVGIFSDEGGQFVGGYGLSQDNRLRTVAGLSSLWDGAPIKRIRVVDGISILPGRRLSLHLMVQPDVGAVLLSDPVLKDQGFLSRVLVSAPPSLVGTRFQQLNATHHSQALVAYNSRILQILHAPLSLVPGTINELMPRRIQMDQDAAALWLSYADHVEAQLAVGGQMEAVRALGNKLAEHAARIAGILSVIENPAIEAVSVDAMARSIAISEYFAGEAVRLQGAGMASPQILLAESLLYWLQTKWREDHVGLKVIYQLGPNAIREATVARKAVTILQEHGWLIKAPSGVRVAGSKVREAWRVVR